MITLRHLSRFFKSQQEQRIIMKITRQGFYFTVLLAVVLGLWRLSSYYKTNTFAEYGLVENLQLTTLILSTGIFLMGAYKNKTYRPVVLLLAGLTAFCSVRELDSFFERILPVINWKFAYIFPLAALGYAYTKRKTLKKPLFDFLDSPAFDLMFTALIVFIPLAQCIGHRSFIADATGTSENLILIRRMIEESMELMAYTLILLSSVELYFGLLKKKN